MRKSGREEHLWGVSGLTTGDGQLERPLAQWVRPAVVELEGERLRWEYFDKNAVLGRHGRMGPGLLAEFPKLADAPSLAIRDYARRWGVLSICQHGWPSSHNPPPIVGGIADLLLGVIHWAGPVRAGSP